jgi:predicted Fe-S protein YdhL (DUF1289 family)
MICNKCGQPTRHADTRGFCEGCQRVISEVFTVSAENMHEVARRFKLKQTSDWYPYWDTVLVCRSNK